MFFRIINLFENTLSIHKSHLQIAYSSGLLYSEYFDALPLIVIISLNAQHPEPNFFACGKHVDPLLTKLGIHILLIFSAGFFFCYLQNGELFHLTAQNTQASLVSLKGLIS